MRLMVLIITALIASTMGALIIDPNDVKTCNHDSDCNTFDTTGTGTCVTGSGLCSCLSGTFNDGGKVLNLCKGPVQTTAPMMTVHYTLRSIADGINSIDCDRVTDFTIPYNQLIKEAARAGFSTSEVDGMEIVHLCHKPNGGGAHVLRTSIKVEVEIAKFLSVAAYTTLPFDINTRLRASTGTDLRSVGKVESALAIRDKVLDKYCSQTDGVYVPFSETIPSANGNHECMAVSCTNGFTFDKSVAAPVCVGPGSLVTSNILTCEADTDCGKYGQAGICDVTKKCAATPTTGTCVHFNVGGNTLAQCNDQATPTATQKITLYYILRHGSMVGHPLRKVDCSKEDEFASAYNSLLWSSNVLGKFAAAEQQTASIVHHCDSVIGGGDTLKTSIKVEVFIANLLDSAKPQYTNLANNVNQALSTSTDPKLYAVGGVSKANIGSREAFTGLCPVLMAGAATKVPMGSDPSTTTIADRDCKPVECAAGFSFDKSIVTPFCEGPGDISTSMISTCGTNDDCIKTGTTPRCSSSNYRCDNCIISSGVNLLSKCGTLTDTITLHYVFTHGTMTGDASKVVDCGKEATFASPYEAIVRGVDARAAVITVCRSGNRLSSVVTFKSINIREVVAVGSKFITFASSVNDLLIKSTDSNLKAVGAIRTVHVGTDESFHRLCLLSRETMLRAPLSYANHKHPSNDRECVIIECSEDYSLIPTSESNTCSYKISAMLTSDIVTCGVDADCGVDNAKCDDDYRCSSGTGSVCNHYQESSSGNTYALCNKDAGITDQTAKLYFVLNHRDHSPTRSVDCDHFDATSYDNLLRGDVMVKGDGALRGMVTTAEHASMKLYHTCTKSGSVSTLTTVMVVKVRIEKLLGTTAYTTMAESINHLLSESKVDELKFVGEVSSVHAGTAEAFAALCPPEGQSMSVPFSETNYKSLDKSQRGCTAIACKSGFELSSEHCVASNLTTGKQPAVVSIVVTGELSDIVTHSSSIIATANTALTTSDIVCGEICPISGGGCVSCEETKKNNRGTAALSTEKYTMVLKGTTGKSLSASLSSIRTSFKMLFDSIPELTFDEDSVVVILTFDGLIQVDDRDDGLSNSSIAGIVVSCVVFVVVVIAVIYCLCFRMSGDGNEDDDPVQNSPDADEDEAWQRVRKLTDKK